MSTRTFRLCPKSSGAGVHSHSSLMYGKILKVLLGNLGHFGFVNYQAGCSNLQIS